MSVIHRRPDPPTKNRWVAVVDSGAEDTFIARIERLEGAKMVESETCTHQHRTGQAAKDCAKKMAAKRLTL